MNYAHAAKIADQHAPELILDAEEHGGSPHVCVRKTKDGAPFSIYLPHSTEANPLTPEQEEQSLKDALDAAKAHLA